jgi:hypothetical protein
MPPGLGYPIGNQPSRRYETPYRSVIHHRDYRTEKRNQYITGYQGPTGMGLVTQPMSTYGAGYLAYRYMKTRFADKLPVDKWFTMDNIYNVTRAAEQKLPVFRVALRASQLGDLMSPFVSNKALRWQYSGSEIISDSQRWNEDFHKVRDAIFKNKKAITVPKGIKGRLTEDQIRDVIHKHGLEFEKKGHVYGNIISRTPQGKFTFLSDTFIMERASAGTQFSGLSSLWEASRRTTVPFQALSKDHWLIQGGKRFLGDRFTPKWQDRIRRFGGFASNYGGDFAMEFFRGMNRFLKEPIPFADRLLGYEKTRPLVDPLSKDPLGSTLNRFLGTGQMEAQQRVPFGRLPELIRPYVTSKYWQQTPLRMLTAISAKGAFYVKGLPTAYFLADTLRRKFDEPGMGVISTPLFAGIGLAAGSAIKSGQVKKWPWQKFPITKTQLGGAVAGGLIGLLPTFDKGIGAGFGSLWGRANIAGAKLWDAVGGQESLRRQEELFPGLTSPITAAGFVMTGGVMGFLHREVGTVKTIAGTPMGYQSKFYDSVSKQLPGVLSAVEEANKLMALGKDLTPAQQARVTRAQDLFSGLFKQYQGIEQIGRLQSVTEATKILAGEELGRAPRSQAGLLAMAMRDRLAHDPELTRGFAARVSTPAAIQELGGRLFMHAEEISGQFLEQDHLARTEGMSATRSAFEKFKRTVKSPTPSAMRGAMRGGLAFGAVSMLGAIVAGPMGGNFSPIDLVPGWLIRATGGGYSSKEAEDVYTGRKEVAIRKARWWAFGRTPFEGTKVSYFRKHRSVLMQSDAKVNALYGSREEMEAYSPILHPIRALLEPDFMYHRDMRMAQISPTPLTGRLFTDVPIFGELLASTVGELVKPTKAIRPNEWMTGGTSTLASFFSNQEVQAPPGYFGFQNMGQAPPIGALGGKTDYDVKFQSSLGHMSKWTFERMSEQAGLRGFMLGTVLENFGYKTRDYKPVVERGERLYSARETFWSMNLGDPFGTTEGMRRYLTRDRNEYYNPLTNMAPSWLPSRNYFRDFKHGNYFAKVNEGYLRLPGAGYETLNPGLRGMHPENYPLAHKYKILTDVAYQSDEWKFVKEQVIQGLQAGKLDTRSKEIVAETNRQIKERSQKRVFRKYQFDQQKMKAVKLDVTAVYEDGSFSVAQYGKRQVKLGGVNYSFAALARQMLERENASTMAAAEGMARDKQREIVGKIRGAIKPGSQITGYVSATETDQYGGSATEIYIPGLSNDIVKMGAEAKDGDFLASVKYNSAQKLFGRAWETFTHNADLPLSPALALNSILPFQPQAKFIQRLTPTELYARTQVYGRDIQMWQRYKEDFLDTAIHETTAKVLGDFVPRKVAYRRAIMEYFDKLTWTKNFMLESAARKAGNKQAVEFYASKKRQTIFGADPYKGFSDIWRALPGSERDFYKEFSQETDEGERNKILALVPEFMKHVYIAQWQNKDIQALSNKVEAGMASSAEKKNLSALYNMRRVEGMNWSHNLQRQYEVETKGGQDADYSDWMRVKQLNEYFKHFKMPSANWVGFDPRVDLEDVKLQVAKQEGIDIHDLGLWGSREASIENKPYVVDAGASLEDWEQPQTAGQFESQIRTQIGGLASSISVSPLPMGMKNRVVMAASNTRSQEIKRLQSGYGVI